jgi:hypothetical protein
MDLIFKFKKKLTTFFVAKKENDGTVLILYFCNENDVTVIFLQVSKKERHNNLYNFLKNQVKRTTYSRCNFCWRTSNENDETVSIILGDR